MANEWARHGDQRQRHRAGLFRHQQYRGPAADDPVRSAKSWGASRPGAGASPRTSAARRSFSPVRPAATSTAWFCRSTAAGRRASRSEAVQPVLEVRMAVAVAVGGPSAGVGGVEALAGLPVIRHAVAVGVDPGLPGSSSGQPPTWPWVSMMPPSRATTELDDARIDRVALQRGSGPGQNPIIGRGRRIGRDRRDVRRGRQTIGRAVRP
jgi:hypothetical protein